MRHGIKEKKGRRRETNSKGYLVASLLWYMSLLIGHG